MYFVCKFSFNVEHTKAKNQLQCNVLEFFNKILFLKTDKKRVINLARI